MQNVTKTFLASASEIKSSDLYMTIKTVVFTVPEPNLNGTRCTEAFLDEIVENQSEYVCLPLRADIKKLERGQYEKLGHCYNPVTGKFSSAMIGAFYKFEKEEIDGGYALIGYARVMKREEDVCAAIAELYDNSELKFSFELSVGEYTENEDGTITVDRSDRNTFEGAAIVSHPACPSATALELVAEVTDNQGKEAVNMEVEKQEVAEVVEEVKEEVAEAAEAVIEETAEVTENAEVRLCVEHCEHDEVRAYDTETGIETVVCDDHREETYGIPAQGIARAEEETAACKEKCAEDAPEEKPEEEEEKPEDKPEEETAACGKHEEEDAACKKECAETEVTPTIAELQQMIVELRNIVAELQKEKEDKTIVASKKEETIEVNPFIGEIATENKYSLLEPVVKQTNYSLLEKA